MLTTALTGFTTHAGWAGGAGWLYLLIPLFWITFFVILFAFLSRRWRRGWAGPGGGPGYYYGGPGWQQGQADARSAEKTLAERFAQGDIDEVEYRARLEVLRANRPDGSGAASAA